MQPENIPAGIESQVYQQFQLLARMTSVAKPHQKNGNSTPDHRQFPNPGRDIVVRAKVASSVFHRNGGAFTTPMISSILGDLAEAFWKKQLRRLSGVGG
jgi:hypothetical protein